VSSLFYNKVINNLSQKAKPKLNMTTKSLSRKQIIILMGSNNAKRVMAKANVHVSNINRLLKKAKSEIFIDFICFNNKRLLIITNKVATILSQIRYSLVVIFELNSVSGVQYKNVMMIDDGKYQ